MKKSIWIAFIYAIAAMVGGVFYREFTKFYNYSDTTSLAVVHLHLFVLGAVVFLLIALFYNKLQLNQAKLWKPFLIVYNIGLPFMVIMFLVRGIMQVVGYDGGAMISGIAGVSHITLGAGIILFFIMLLQAVGKNQSHKNQAV